MNVTTARFITQTKIDFYQPVLGEISSALVGPLLVWAPKQLLMPQEKIVYVNWYLTSKTTAR